MQGYLNTEIKLLTDPGIPGNGVKFLYLLHCVLCVSAVNTRQEQNIYSMGGMPTVL